MNNLQYILLAIIFVSLACILIWATLELSKEVKKDWATLEELKQKAYKLNTKEEIEEFYKEFVDKASKINNRHIHIELQRIDGYLNGLYKQYIN